MDNYELLKTEVTEKKHAINAELQLMREKVWSEWDQAICSFTPYSKRWTKEQREINNKWAELYDRI